MLIPTTGAIEDVTVTASGTNYTTDIRVSIRDVAVGTTIANAFPEEIPNVVVGNPGTNVPQQMLK